MKRAFTWKTAAVLLGAFLLVALACQVSGNPGAASAFVVCGIGEILFWGILMMIRITMGKMRPPVLKVSSSSPRP
jgi:hypothetical protein